MVMILIGAHWWCHVGTKRRTQSYPVIMASYLNRTTNLIGTYVSWDRATPLVEIGP